MTDQKSGYRRRIREKAEKQKQDAEREQNKSAEQAKVGQIVAAIERVTEKLDRQADENTPQKKRERTWQHAEVIGLWVAATVGIAAIAVANHDSEKQFTAIHNQQIVMQGQLDAMYNDQRPWVSVDPIIASKLRYDDNGIGVTIDLRLKNPGRSPAMNVRADGKMTFAHKLSDHLRAQRELCDSLPLSPQNNLIFPGTDPVSQWMPFTGGREEVAKARSATAIPDRMIAPYLIGCVRYEFGADNSKHRTGFLYQLMHVPPFGIIDAHNGDTDAKDLMLMTGLWGNWAD